MISVEQLRGLRPEVCVSCGSEPTIEEHIKVVRRFSMTGLGISWPALDLSQEVDTFVIGCQNCNVHVSESTRNRFAPRDAVLKWNNLQHNSLQHKEDRHGEDQ